MSDPQWPIGLQIGIVTREISKRREVYPRLVGLKQMSQKNADLQIAGMEAVLKTLEGLRDQSAS